MFFYLKDCHHSEGDISKMLETQSTIRLISYTLVFITLIIRFIYGIFSYSPQAVISIALAACFLSAATLFIVRSKLLISHYKHFIQVLPVVDILFVTFIVHFSGGIESKFAFLYVLPCLSLVLFSLRDVVRVSIVSLGAYAAVMAADYYDLFPNKIVIDYTAGQLAVTNMLRLSLIISIAVITVILLIVRSMRMYNVQKEKNDEVLFSIAQSMSEPLEGALTLLETLEHRQTISHNASAAIERLKTRVVAALEQKTALLETIEEPTPVTCNFNWHAGLTCRLCSNPIKIAEQYWSIPKSYKLTHTFGKYQNDVHCNACHLGRGAASCSYCEIWNKKA